MLAAHCSRATNGSREGVRDAKEERRSGRDRGPKRDLVHRYAERKPRRCGERQLLRIGPGTVRADDLSVTGH